MGERSAIEWTDATWNPWRGCDKVSPGCAHCYMFAGQRQYGRDPSVVVKAAKATWEAPLSRKWRHKAADIFNQHDRRMRVFTCSWSDWFHETADPWRDEAWAIIRACREYDFQILTKRPERVAECLPADWGDGWPHVWLGTSIENRRFAHRADQLRDIPAAVRFISAEPLLGPLTECGTCHGRDKQCPFCHGQQPLDLTDIDWLIVGGESGPGYRPIREQWVRDLRDLSQQPTLLCCGMRDDLGRCCNQPDNEGPRTAFFFKQWGGLRPGGEALLDGREWREFPRSASFVGQGSLL